jgi:hypothetical protein
MTSFTAVVSDHSKETQPNGGGRKFRTLVGRRYKGNVSKYLSVANRKVGTIREEWCNQVLEDQGFNIGDEFSRSEYDPDMLWNSLSAYDGESTFNLNGAERACFQRAVSKVESHFKDFYGLLKALPLDENLWESVKKETSSGLPSLLPKKLVFDEEVIRAQTLLERERLQRSGNDSAAQKIPGPEPALCFYRTQASVKEGTPKKKVRMVWGYPLSMILLEACYARPVIDLFLQAVTPVSLGYRKSELGALVASTAWWPVSGTFDWSQWDANAPTQLISETFRIVKKFFESVDEDHWNLITRYFSTCPILMQDGFVYTRRRKGIPSGSFFTSIIGSIANMIAIHFLAFLQGLDVVGIHVLGDDSLVGFTGDINIGFLTKSARRCLGMKLNLEKLAYGSTTANPRYLGHDWFRGRIRRPVIETAQRIKFPERYNRHWFADRYDKLISLYGDNVDAWPLIMTILKRKGLAYRHGSGEQFLLQSFRDVGGFTMTESPELRGERKRFAAATLK